MSVTSVLWRPLTILRSDHQKQVWAWDPGEDSETLYYERDDVLRFQVIDEEWHDQTPEGPRKPGQHAEKKVSPYSIKATLANAGLGLCAWWDYPTEEE